MLKIRYYRIRVPGATNLNSLEGAAYRARPSGVSVLRASSAELVLRYTRARHLQAIQLLDDGSEVKTSIPTVEQCSMRLFGSNGEFILSVLDPPRGQRVAVELLTHLLEAQEFFMEPLEVAASLIQRHIRLFDAARLVSAKVRDFKVSDTAVGRLEVTSKSGLPDEIAPFLAGKYYRVDSLTYEVTHQFQRGLMQYASSGTLRVSGPLVEVAFPMFEKLLFNERR
jgi:hypothetical protein